MLSLQQELQSQSAILSSKTGEIRQYLQKVKQYKKEIQTLKSDRDNRDTIIKQLKTEMEDYADQMMKKEENEVVLESTVKGLIEQITQLTVSENIRAVSHKKEIADLRSEKSSRLRDKSPNTSSQGQAQKKPISFVQRRTSFLVSDQASQEGTRAMESKMQKAIGDQMKRRSSKTIDILKNLPPEARDHASSKDNSAELRAKRRSSKSSAAGGGPQSNTKPKKRNNLAMF